MADYLLNVVAAGVSPAVEPGILPGGLNFRIRTRDAVLWISKMPARYADAAPGAMSGCLI